MSEKLLIEDRPLQLLPQLAIAIGVEEAIIIQQIHFLCRLQENGKILNDGEKYVWNTYEDWRTNVFPFWSVSTIKRKFANLIEMDLLVVKKPNKADYDHTNYYRVNKKKLAELNKNADTIGSVNLNQSVVSDWNDQAAQSDTISKGTKTSSKTSSKRGEEANASVESEIQKTVETKSPPPDQIQDKEKPKTPQENESTSPYKTSYSEKNSYFAAAVEVYMEEFPTIQLDGYKLGEFNKAVKGFDLKLWRKVLRDWKLNGHRSGNLAGMVSRYEKELEYQNKTKQTTELDKFGFAVNPTGRRTTGIIW